MNNQQLTGLSNQHISFTATNHQLNHHCIADFTALQQAALNAGFSLTIASSFRDFERQLMIWNNKFNGIRPVFDRDGQPLDVSKMSCIEKIHAIMRWSALPGASRHHWGTDIDVYASNTLPKGIKLQLEPWEYISGHQAQFSLWLQKNAAQYGFFFPYRTERNGVAIEPWHISHKEEASQLMPMLTPELLLQVWQDVDLAGKEVIIEHIETLFCRYVTNIENS